MIERFGQDVDATTVRGLKNDEAIKIAQTLDARIHQGIVTNIHTLKLEIQREAAALRGQSHGIEDETELMRATKEKIRASLEQALKEVE